MSTLKFLAAVQHALLGLLLIAGTARAIATGVAPGPAIGASLGFLAIYLVGVGFSQTRGAHGTPTVDAKPAPKRPAYLFLALLTVAWVGLVVLSPAYAWLVFSLWLLAGHFLPWAGAALYTLATFGIVVAAPLWHGLTPSMAEIVGPFVGGLFALVMSRGQVEIARDARERQRLVDELLAAQHSAEMLTEQLVAAERAAGVEAERARLSRDIHDTLAQGFSSIILLARGAARHDEPDVLKNDLARIETTAVENLAEARRVVADLAPQDLGDAGLAAALRRIVTDFGSQTGIDASLRIEADNQFGEFAALSTATGVALLRTAQGALANVRAHAQASRVVVTLSDVGNAVLLDVVDDGVGFDPAQAASKRTADGGYGLAGLRRRLAELGGTLSVESSPGHGTALSAMIPMNPTQGGDDDRR